MGFSKEAEEAIERASSFVRESEESQGAVLVTACLCAALCYLGEAPVMKVGLTKYEGVVFYNAWLELGGAVVDPAGAGAVAFSGAFGKRGYEFPLPMEYSWWRSVQHWEDGPFSGVKGKSIMRVLDASPGREAWGLACIFLGRKETAKLMDEIRSAVMYCGVQ